jgi:hypothetical protein
MALDERILEEAKAARRRVLDVQHDLDLARADLEDLIRRLAAAGGTQREVGAALGVSHQRIHQIVDAAPFPSPAPGDMPGLLARVRPRRRVERAFSRLDEATREILAAGQGEARALGHDYLGSEHALLALARAERPAGEVLRRLGLGAETVREAIVRIVAGGRRPTEGRRRECIDPGAMPLTPRFKRVLETATVVTPPGQPIQPEHLLIAVARVRETVGARILAERGVDEQALVGAFIRLDETGT